MSTGIEVAGEMAVRLVGGREEKMVGGMGGVWEQMMVGQTAWPVAGKMVAWWDIGLVVSKAAWRECGSVGLWVSDLGSNLAAPSVV